MVEQRRKPTRVTSGIAGLDVVLNGGFLDGSVYIFIGPPGAGKTILANQVAFHHVANGGRVVYCTLLAESHSRMFMNMEALQFFAAHEVSSTIQYLSGYKVLEESGLPGLLSLLRREAQRNKATLLILDGLVSAEAFAASTLEVKKFVHELQTITGLVGCTGFLLTSGSDDRLGSPEHTMVDGLIELTNAVVGVRQLRLLHLKKFRGSAHLGGTHSFQIDERGITVFPRLESIVTARQRAPGVSHEVMSTGVKGLDAMLGGGLQHGSTSLIVGPTGSGKAMLGLHFLDEGLKRGEKVVYFGFHESPERLVSKARRVGIELGTAEQEGRLKLVWHPSVDLLIDALAHEMLDTVKATGATRLVVDSLQGFEDAVVVPERIPRFLAALANELRRREVTTYFCDETRALFPIGVDAPAASVSSVVDNVVFLRQVELDGRLQHVAAVLKTRESAHTNEVRRVQINASGVQIGGPVEGAQGVLSGMPTTIPTSRAGRQVGTKKGGRKQGRSKR